MQVWTLSFVKLFNRSVLNVQPAFSRMPTDVCCMYIHLYICTCMY